MCCIYKTENCKNHFKILGQIIFKKKKKSDMTTDVTQYESNNIKHYASAFSNIQIDCDFKCVSVRNNHCSFQNN